MKLKYLIMLLFCSFISFAQTKYESGNYIDSNNIKHEGFIKNLDWNSNPSQIIFKQSLTGSDESNISSDYIKEFEIYGISKYKKANVNIDISSTSLSDIGFTKEPIFEYKEVLLKVVLEGKKTLYFLNASANGKYFYNNSNGEIEELIYKKYRLNDIDAAKMKEDGQNVNAYTTILINKEYLKQLFNYVNCNINREKINKVTFTESSLVNYFKDYNECENAEFRTFKPTKNTEFKIKALVALNNSSVDLNNNNNRALYSKNFDNKMSLGAGVELELVFPYNNNKWAAFIETSFNTYKDNAVLEDDTNFSLYRSQNVTVQYNYIQISPGVRHYFFLNENSKISVDVIYNIKRGIGDNKVDYESTGNLPMTDKMIHNFAIGANYNYKNYSIGIRAYDASNILEITSDYRYVKYSNLSFLLKYTLL